MKRRFLIVSVVLTALIFVATFFSPAAARVSGPCNNCHTMHNSQNGSSMALTGAGWDGATLQGTPTSTSNGRLTITTCVGCHTATTGGTIIDLGDGTRVPIVNSGGGYPAGPLAGGYWGMILERRASSALRLPTPVKSAGQLRCSRPTVLKRRLPTAMSCPVLCQHLLKWKEGSIRHLLPLHP